MPRASLLTIWATIFRDFATNFCSRIDYSFSLLRRAKRARQEMTTSVTERVRQKRRKIILMSFFRKTLKIEILYDIGIKVYCLVWRILKQ